jgi:hypothetical protein
MRRRAVKSLTRRLLDAVLEAARISAALKLSVEADGLEARYGRHAVDEVRDAVLKKDRRARRRLYRLHDELARRRDRDGGGLAGGLPA